MPRVPTASRAGLGVRTQQARTAQGFSIPDAATGGEQARNLQGVAAVADQGATSLLNAADRIATRKEAIDRTRTLTSFNETVQEEFSRFQTEEDLTDPDAAGNFATYLSEKRQEALGSFQGREGARAKLETRLLDDTSRYRVSMSGASIEAQRVAIDGFLKTQINAGGNKVYSDPSSYDENVVIGDAEIADLEGGLTPEQERIYKAGMRSSYAISAASGLIDQGQIESAEDLLNRPDVIENLSNNDLRRLQGEINTQREQANQWQQEFQRAEAVMGRPLSDIERARMLGIEPPQQAQRADPLIPVEDPNNPGQSILIPQSQAAGMRPASSGNGPLEQTQLALAQSKLASSQMELAGAQREQDKEAVQRGAARENSFQVAQNIDELGTSMANSITQGITSGFNNSLGAFDKYLSNPELDRGIERLQSLLSLESIKSAKASGVSFGSLTEGEALRAGQSVANLSRANSPDAFARELEDALGFVARMNYGSDIEINAAIKTGELTEAEATAQRDARDRMLASAEANGDAIRGEAKNVEREQAATEKRTTRLEKMAANPNFNPTEDQLVGLTDEQLDRIDAAYFAAQKGTGDGN